jgi:glycosyltransferase involved in cell wall biosynthesis
MKILYINYLYSPHIGGGAEITIKSIVEGIQRLGHEVVVLATGPGVGLSEEKVDGVRVYRAGIENLYWPFEAGERGALAKLSWHWRDRYNAAMGKYVSEVVRKERPDVASCHNVVGFSVSTWDALRSASVPIVQVLHDLYLLCYRSTMFRKDESCPRQCLSCKLFRTQHAHLSADVDAVVGVSRFVLDKLCGNGYFRSSRQLVINNARPIPSRVRARTTTDAVTFGFIGTLVKSKGIEWLIESFKMIERDGMSLKIAGRGTDAYVQHLKELAQDSKIEFVGYVSPSSFFGEIDVSVVPSLWSDTFPGVAFESLAYEVPVIATNRGGLPEIVKHDVAGIICDPDDPGSLANAMSTIFKDRPRREKMISNARDSVSRLTDMQRMIGEYERLYDALSASNVKNHVGGGDRAYR